MLFDSRNENDFLDANKSVVYINAWPNSFLLSISNFYKIKAMMINYDMYLQGM